MTKAQSASAKSPKTKSETESPMTKTARAQKPSPQSVEETPTAPPPPAAVPLTVSHMFGEMAWLLTQSPTHKHYSLADLEWMVMPALLLQQYRVFRDGARPVGVALWAFLSEEAEVRLADGKSHIRPDEWKSGDRCWLIDLVAPFSTAENQMIGRMLTDLSQTVLKGREFKFWRTDPATGKRKAIVIEVSDNE
jgi:cytolysin-activating lysine-acyltransferase